MRGTAPGARLAVRLLVAACAGLPAAGDVGAELLEISGPAFGTSWRVRSVAEPGAPPAASLAREVESVLASLDARLSTWRRDSELSRFNASRTTDWWGVAPDTARVVGHALAVHRLSGGAFDPTLSPLVELWGFGPVPRRPRPPTSEELSAARARVGASRLRVRAEPPALRKASPDLSLDLSGVAKGYAVDALVRRLRALGLSRFLVEVGGELRSAGAGPGGHPWRVGIERPGSGDPRVGWRIDLEDAALATSGSYRRFFEWEGRRFSHVLDPRSARPVEHALVSVSVMAPRAVRADGWATALFVLGPDEGWRVAQRHGLAVLFVADRGGRLEARATPALGRHRVRRGGP